MTLIRKGPRGGEYIIRNKRKVYLSSMSLRERTRMLRNGRKTKRMQRRSTSHRRRSCKPGKNKKFAKVVKGKCIRFGDPNMKIKKQNPKRKKAFCSRHNCKGKHDPATPGYQSCKKWSCQTGS